MRIPRVYVAGPYSADNVHDVLKNMRRGMELASQLFSYGFYPFVPWWDFLFYLVGREDDYEQFTHQMFLDYSMAFLEVCDAVILADGWRESKGTMAELERAKHLHIPIYESVHDFQCNYDKDCALDVTRSVKTGSTTKAIKQEPEK